MVEKKLYFKIFKKTVLKVYSQWQKELHLLFLQNSPIGSCLNLILASQEF